MLISEIYNLNKTMTVSLYLGGGLGKGWDLTEIISLSPGGLPFLLAALPRYHILIMPGEGNYIFFQAGLG